MFSRNPLSILLLLLLIAGSVTQAQEQPVARVWVKHFDSEGHIDDSPNAIAVDPSGNIFVAGISRVPSFQTGTNDSLLIKYSGSGEALWTNHFPTVDPVAVGTDTNGNLFMTGSTQGETSGTDITTMAFSGEGAVLWTNVYSSPASFHSETPYGMALDQNGNIYVVGFSEGAGSGMHAVLKYANDGSPLWTNYFSGGPLAGLNSALCIDLNGDVIATGSSIGTNGYSHYQTVKFTSLGTPLWTNWYYGPGNYADVIKGVASDALGNVYVTGTSWANTTDTQEDIATLAYSPSGVALWTNRFDGPAHGWDQAARIGVNAKGNVVVTGNAETQSGAPAYLVLLAYNPAGTPLWTKYYNHGIGEPNVTIAFDEFGNTLLAGTSSGIGGDFLVLKVSNDGTGISTNHFNGTFNDSDWVSGIAAGRNGDFYVTGAVRDMDNGVVSWNFATLKYSVIDPIPLQIAMNEGQAVFSWSNPLFQLQSTKSTAESFTNVPDAVSGYTTPLDTPQRYYQLIAP